MFGAVHIMLVLDYIMLKSLFRLQWGDWGHMEDDFNAKGILSLIALRKQYVIVW